MDSHVSLKVSLQWLFENEPALESDLDVVAFVERGQPGRDSGFRATSASGRCRPAGRSSCSARRTRGRTSWIRSSGRRSSSSSRLQTLQTVCRLRTRRFFLWVGGMRVTTASSSSLHWSPGRIRMPISFATPSLLLLAMPATAFAQGGRPEDHSRSAPRRVAAAARDAARAAALRRPRSGAGPPHSLVARAAVRSRSGRAGAPVGRRAARAGSRRRRPTNFDGIGQGFTGPAGTFVVNSAPPDTNGAVGPNHVVEIVNTDFAVFSRPARRSSGRSRSTRCGRDSAAAARSTTTAIRSCPTTASPTAGSSRSSR